MANTRIKDISTAASSVAADDFLALDGATSGTRKITKENLSSSLDFVVTADVNDQDNSRAPSNGLSLDGANDYLSFGNASLLDIGADEDFSIAGVAYFATNPSGYEVLYSKRGSSGDGYNVQINPSGRLFAYIDAANGSNNSPDDGESLAGKLFHWVVTFDRSGNLTRYVNGSQYGAAVDISSQNGSLSNTASGLLGYTSGGSSYFSGEIRGFQFFNKALSASEVARLAATGAPDIADQWGDGSTSGCVLALLQTPGSIEASGKWLDSSSNELNGTVNGSPKPLYKKPQISGTFTPTLTFGDASVGMTYATNGQEGYWRKLDEKTVLIELLILLTDKGSSTTYARVEGLPFTVRAPASGYNVVSTGVRGLNMQSLTGGLSATFRQNTTSINLLQSSATGEDLITHANFTNSSSVGIAGVYTID